MKNKMIKYSTKISAVMLVAATVITAAAPTVYAAETTTFDQKMSDVSNDGDGVERESDDYSYEEATHAELVPEAQFIDDLNKTEYICEDGYEPIIKTELVSNPPVIIDDPEPEPEIVYNDDVITRAVMVPDAPVIINELVPEEAPVIINGPLLYKEMVSNAPVRLDEAPEEPEVSVGEETVTPTETEVVKQESKSKPRRLLPDTYEEIPHYGEIKQCYFDKGAGVAFWTFIYYHPTPLGYEVIEHIEKEIREGNRGYTIDGVYYDCPEHDPYFANDPYFAQKRK